MIQTTFSFTLVFPEDIGHQLFKAMQLLDAVPDYKIGYVVAYLQGVTAGEDEPNAETIAAFAEGDKMLADGTGQRYTNTKDLFVDLEN